MSTKKIQVIGSMVPQSDWAQTDESKVDYIKNKPELGNLAAKNTVEKSDLTTDVQTSLGKADTALQSYTETDPTVPSWAKQSTKPTYTKEEVGLGNVENKSSETIRSELTKDNVITALGYTPPTTEYIDTLELITIADIDAICGSGIQVATASEVTF